MAMPNPINPEDHGEEIPSTSARREHEDNVLAALQADLEGSTAAKLAAQLVPVVPDGGHVGRAITPAVHKAAKVGDTVRLWAPAAATAAFAGAAMVFPLTGPLAIYGAGLVGFAFWHCAGRPGPIQALLMVIYTTTDALDRIREWVRDLAERRAAYEDRRTKSQ
ncbi:hypothetical protein [Nocardia flavorosea]|uniref:Uncharacterized protein n=1 Tax=Nocardia flavorosea TaxID=53429 RepID=A0A846YP93_9NOCA|nr:hypothetical protein [Nocardia flavorosea]NKY60945.1 hypothetical protein [Nocardia flavorosea]